MITKTNIAYRYQFSIGDGIIQEKVLRKFMQGFMQVHILYHAKVEPFYGSWMIGELKKHGYDVSPGTLYPVLHNMEATGLLEKEERLVEGKVRKYYAITEMGITVLMQAKQVVFELFHEMEEIL